MDLKLRTIGEPNSESRKEAICPMIANPFLSRPQPLFQLLSGSMAYDLGKKIDNRCPRKKPIERILEMIDPLN
jgi:hypothetical protein